MENFYQAPIFTPLENAINDSLDGKVSNLGNRWWSKIIIRFLTG